MALGAGLMIGALLMSISFQTKVNFNIEEKARARGMVFPDEIRVNLEKGE